MAWPVNMCSSYSCEHKHPLGLFHMGDIVTCLAVSHAAQHSSLHVAVGDCTQREGVSVHVGRAQDSRGGADTCAHRGAGHRLHRWHAAAAIGG